MRFTRAQTLNDGWRFMKTLAAGVETPQFDDRWFQNVTLPHDWQILAKRDPDMEWGWAQGYYPRAEIGWYRKWLDAPDAWRGKTVRLIVDGCQRFWDLYANGARVGGHKYGYVPEVIDMTDALKYGEKNLLCVRVNNADTVGDRWYSGAGLDRGVRLLISEPVHIAPWSLITRTSVAGEEAELDLSVNIENRSGADADIQLSAALTAPDGHVLRSSVQAALTPGQAAVSMRFHVVGVQLWDMDAPNLYPLSLELFTNDQPCDRIEETIGFRTFSFDGEHGFTLNGRARKLYGADLHHDAGACFGSALPASVLRRRLLALKAIGCNAIRCSHNPHPEALCDLCDALGLVVIDELYDKWCGSQIYFERLFDDRFRDLDTMIARDRNHPCIVLWSVGNEVEVQYQERFYDHLKALCGACRERDPSRPVSMALIGFCTRGYDDSAPLEKKLDAALRYADTVDVFMGNYMENYYTALREAGMNKAILGSEVFTYYRHAELTTTNVLAQSPWADVSDRPYVAGGFIWAGVDYLGESTGYPCKGWTGCPIDSAGFPKLRAAYIQSQWSSAPMLRVGVLDDTAYDDHANPNWGFPLMTGCWHAAREGLMRHVCVMTNCDEVRLYVNQAPARVAKPDAPDRMAHFMVIYRAGTLRAEGWRGGEKVAEQTLYTPGAPETLSLACADGTRSGDVFHVELSLLDGHGQLCERERAMVTVTVTGDADLVGLDNGDFMGDHDVHGTRCPFHLGRAVAYLRARGAFALEAVCGALSARIEG